MIINAFQISDGTFFGGEVLRPCIYRAVCWCKYLAIRKQLRQLSKKFTEEILIISIRNIIFFVPFTRHISVIKV